MSKKPRLYFNFKDFDEAQQLVTDLFATEFHIMKLKGLELQLNAPHPQPANEFEKWLPLEYVVGIEEKRLHTIVRSAIFKELKARYLERKRQLMALGMKFDPEPKTKGAKTEEQIVTEAETEAAEKIQIPKRPKPALKLIKGPNAA